MHSRMRHLKPREIQGCQLELDASIPGSLYNAASGGSLVTVDSVALGRWEDQSGNGRHATQSSGGLQPELGLNAYNSMPTIKFINRKWMTAGSFLNGKVCSWFAVAKHFTLQSVNSIISAGRGGNDVRAVGMQTHSIYGTPNKALGGGTVKYVNGRSYDTYEFATVPWPLPLVIGATDVTAASILNSTDTVIGGLRDSYGAVDNFFFNGHISLVAAFEGTPNVPTMTRLSHAAMRKWRING